MNIQSSIGIYDLIRLNYQWHRNEFKSLGDKCPAQSARKKVVVPLHFFWLYKHNKVALVSAFVMDSTVWSVSCLLFFYSQCPVPSYL